MSAYLPLHTYQSPLPWVAVAEYAAVMATRGDFPMKTWDNCRLVHGLLRGA